MAVKLGKPILVGGLGISLALWLWDSGNDSIIESLQFSLVGSMAVGMGFWFWQRRRKQPPYTPTLLPLTWEAVEEAIAQARATVELLAQEAPDRDITALKQQLEQLPATSERQSLQLAIAGGPQVGKSKLTQLLASREIAANLSFVEARSHNSPIPNPQSPIPNETIPVTAADVVLFLIAGDLTESEWQILQQLNASRQRILLLFNKQDRYLPEERALILQQLRHRVQEIIPKEDIIPISTAPLAVKVRQHQEDGTVKEWLEPLPPEIETLGDRLRQILSQERQQLVWGTTWREAKGLKRQAQAILNDIRRDRALPVIEQYQWVAAAAAFANPVAALDLLATAAINAQMLVDLSAIYQQKFSLSQAQAASGTIGKLMVQLGLVELSTQTIGNLLKSNALTYLAGGGVQGISAAYLTRLAGLSLIEYFQELEVSQTSDTKLNWEKLGQKLQGVFQQNQRTAFLTNFVRQALTVKSFPTKKIPAI